MNTMPAKLLRRHYVMMLRPATMELFAKLPVQLKMRAALIPDEIENPEWRRIHAGLLDHFEGGSHWNFRQSVGPFSAAWDRIDANGISLLVQLFSRAARESFAVEGYRQAKRNIKIFPYVEYRVGLDCQDDEEHKGLDGKVFDLNDDFLLRHFPPWGWGCDCSLVARRAGITSALSTPPGKIDFFRPDLYETEFELTGEVRPFLEQFGYIASGKTAEPRERFHVDQA